MGKGRVVVMGNTDAMEHDGLAVGDTARLLTNTLRWVSGEKSEPKIGVYKVPGLASRVKSLGLDARDIELKDRSQVDTVITLARTVAAQDVAPLAEYIRGGGGLLTGARYYMLERVFPGVDLANELPVSRLTALAGIAWAHSDIQPNSGRGFRVEPPEELSHAGKALAAFEDSESHKRFLSEKEQLQMYAALSHAALDLPQDEKLVLPRLDRALARFQAGAVPSAEMPVARDDVPWRLAITRATERLPSACAGRRRRTCARTRRRLNFPGPYRPPRSASRLPCGWRRHEAGGVGSARAFMPRRVK
jgi:hypothetical protein